MGDLSFTIPNKQIGDYKNKQPPPNTARLLFHAERPMTKNKKDVKIKQLPKIFNGIVSHHRNAEVGFINPFSQRVGILVNESNVPFPAQIKQRKAVALISHCVKRRQKVLDKFITAIGRDNFEGFGACFKNRIKRSFASKQGAVKLARKYRVFLAFENTKCE